MKSSISIMLMAVAIMLGLQSCEDPKVKINSNDFEFKAINLTVDGGKLTAAGGTSVNVNWSVTVTMNGETKWVSGTSMSDELPVRVGDEIEIQFVQSCPEQTEASFTMPDGTFFKATVNAPNFKWTVPSNFTAGMQIKGNTHYKTKDYVYTRTGSITLIALE